MPKLDNVEIETNDNTITIKIDKTKRLYKTKSDNDMVATTHGGWEIEPGLKLNLNLWKRP